MNCITSFFYFKVLNMFIKHIIIARTDNIICVYFSCMYIASLLFFSILFIKVVVIKMYIRKIRFINAFRSFPKRFLVCLLCIILAFSTVCKPKDVNAVTLGTATTWGIVDFLAAIAASAGISVTAYEFFDGLGFFEGKDGPVSEDEALQWCKNNISVDGNNNVVFTDDAKQFINNYILGTYNDSVTMMYRYPFRPDYLEADWFPNKTMYTAFVDMVKQHPEFYFDVFVEAGNQMLSFYVYRSDDCLSAVNANFDLIVAPCALYNSDWLQNVEGYFMTLDSSCTLRVYDNLDSGLGSPCTEFKSFNEAVEKGNKMSFVFPQSNCIRADNMKWSLPNWSRTNHDYLVSSHAGAINCYKSVADMKKDLGSQVVGKYTSDYTGQPNYNITTSEVNSIVNNYYSDNSGGGSGGGSGGSGDSGGGSSGGGIFDNIISGIANGVGSIIKGLFSIIKDLVDAIADAIVSITKSITDLMGLLKGDFTSFLSAVFPFMPQEFITIMVASLALCLLGVIIKIFRG